MSSDIGDWMAKQYKDRDMCNTAGMENVLCHCVDSARIVVSC